MKLSKSTIEVLKNFSTINPSLIIKPGNRLVTVMMGYTIRAETVLKDAFPQDCVIYDISKFLAALNLMGEPEIEFSDKYLTLVGESSSLRMYYGQAPDLEALVSKEIKKKINRQVEFLLTESVIRQLEKAAGVLQVQDIMIESGKKGISIRTLDTSKGGESRGNYEFKVSDEPQSYTGKVVLKVSNLKIIPMDYAVSLCSFEGSDTIRFANFTNDTMNYYITVEAKSSDQTEEETEATHASVG